MMNLDIQLFTQCKKGWKWNEIKWSKEVLCNVEIYNAKATTTKALNKRAAIKILLKVLLKISKRQFEWNCVW